MPVLGRYAHLADKPLGGGLEWAVLARPQRTGQEERGESTLYSIPILPRSMTWTDSAASTKLGFPLKIAIWKQSDNELFNKSAQLLQLVCEDSTSAAFGTEFEQVWIGDVVIARIDGLRVDEFQVRSLLDYLMLDMSAFGRKLLTMEESNAKQIVRNMLCKKLTPDAYLAYFKEWRRHHVVAGEAEFAHVKLPVDAVGKACGDCGSLEGDGEGGTLRKCTRCQQRWYCGRACQKREWKHHKLVCTSRGAQVV